MKIVHVISISGGKDSTAMLLLALEKFLIDELRFIFADTGNEHADVYRYLDYLEKTLSIKIDRLRVNFDKQIANKRIFIARDMRAKRVYKTINIKDDNGSVIRKKKIGGGKKIRWTNKAKRRALSVLYPSGNAFLDLCLWKGRFPSRRAQFCTQFLKTEPMIKYQHSLVDDGYTVVSWQGIRREESLNRRDVLQIEYAGSDIWQYRPIADWSVSQVFEQHIKHNIDPNPLYKQGMERVGCMPCINANKRGINEIGKRFQDHVKRIAEWEKLVTKASKRNGASFFPNLDRDPIDKPDIYAIIKWAGTARGGRQDDWITQEPPLACKSSFGLCE